MLKSDLRVKHLKLRNNLSVEEQERFSTFIFERLITVAIEYDHIGVYISMHHEVDTRKFIQWCFDHDKHVYVPKIVNNGMIFIEMHNLDECTLNKMGILEPIIGNASKTSIELMIVPMLAYNQRNYRLGYGKGYYDQYLRQHDAYKLGICFSMNLENELIEEEHDVKLARIFTELK